VYIFSITIKEVSDKDIPSSEECGEGAMVALLLRGDVNFHVYAYAWR
jgi:hypothetical protein